MDKQKLQELINNQRDYIINNQEELYEQALIANFLPKEAVVLELGGRTGTVSRVINKKLNNPHNHLVIEPNISFTNHLTSLSESLGFNLYMGVISTKPMWAEVWHHQSLNKYMNDTQEILRSIEWENDNIVPSKIAKGHNLIKITNYKTLPELEQEFNLQFDTIVADCEGAMPFLFNDNPTLFDKIKFIQCEWDSFDTNVNDHFRQSLLDKGFKSLYSFGTSMFPKWAVEKRLCGTSNNIGHEILTK